MMEQLSAWFTYDPSTPLLLRPRYGHKRKRPTVNALAQSFIGQKTQIPTNRGFG